MNEDTVSSSKVRASRAGHTFHERWAARRALQLVFPKDDLFAIAVEGLSINETAAPGKKAEDIADLTLYYGQGDTFESCRVQQTLQFKYMAQPKPETSSYLKKTIQKFAATLIGYEKNLNRTDIDAKLTFSFVTNTDFSEQLWEAVRCLAEGSNPRNQTAKNQYKYLKKYCEDEGVKANRLFPLIEFKASTENLPAQNRALSKTFNDWTPGVDSQARMRQRGLEELIREKAGLSGQGNNLVKREDVLDSLGCEAEDLFPANTEFVDVGKVVEREVLTEVETLIKKADLPVFIHAEGGIGKTVFIQNLAHRLDSDFEKVIFDCFGGGSYRTEDQARHLPKIGLLQIVNELASRSLCDPQLPSDGDRYALIKAARKRLEQAVTTVRMQSGKSGLLVIIDAADNAQLEAEHQKEDAFPSLLLASLSRQPVDGLKLILTARSHRMDDVIGRSEIERFELGPFSQEETRRFLESRRSGLTELEFSTVLVRSAGNARVLDYLVSSWDENVSGSPKTEKITVEEIIHQKCSKIHNDLDLAGWSNDEVQQFFVAISLLPPPIPLNEMADALGWSQSKINSAVADLAPMLELLKHGAIFRDEPTETYIRETYAKEKTAQENIADRLIAHQSSSAYAAEALPHFLVVIGNANRAYELSSSDTYPSSILSDYGRRRLRLLRLNAAFSLAVKAQDHDHVLQLTMKLAQVAAANTKGDDFIRRSPGVSVCIGDKDTSRRLFQDRSGWHGARDARLTLAFVFQGEMDEAAIHQDRVIDWINFHHRNQKDEHDFHRESPTAFDFASFVFLSILKGDHATADKNIASLGFRFALSVCHRVIAFAEQYDAIHDGTVLSDIAHFAASKKCLSFALQVSLLGSKMSLESAELKQLSRTASAKAKCTSKDEFDNGYDHEDRQREALCDAALSALIHGSRQSSSNIVRTIKPERVSSYDYCERHRPFRAPFRAWTPIIHSCLKAWSDGKEIRFHHLLPKEVAVNRAAKSIANCSELTKFLDNLMEPQPKQRSNRSHNERPRKLFSSHDCENITKGMEVITFLAEPLQEVLLTPRAIRSDDFQKFVERWKSKLRFDIHWCSKDARDMLDRHVGFEFAKIFLQHTDSVSTKDVETLIDLLQRGGFTIGDKIDVLALMARHTSLAQLVGSFAQAISANICKDEYIEQRAKYYSRLSQALLPTSIDEARAYFREGLSQLDQMGGDDYDIICSVLHYAAEQRGGWLRPDLGHRLMNLCQTICHHEPSKFEWTLFGRAAAQSIGYQAVYKLIRWADQDVSDFSNGLPQLVCFLAQKEFLDPRRATFILLLCKDQGWFDWEIGDGLKDIFEIAKDTHRPTIFRAIFSKLLLEHPLGSSEYPWKSLLKVLEEYPEAAQEEEIDRIKSLSVKGRERRDEENERRNSFGSDHPLFRGTENENDEKEENERAFQEIIGTCDMTLPHAIDDTICTVKGDRRFMFNVRKKVIECLRERCPYDQKTVFITRLTELVELGFDDTIELILDCVEDWEASSLSVSSGRKDFIRKLFESKGSDLFALRHSAILSEIKRLINFCGDGRFVLNLVFDTISKEKIELSGDGWLQLATSLCPFASPDSNLGALEDLLSGPAAKIGDEIGEGTFKAEFSPAEDQNALVVAIAWHLLGSSATFTRWAAARSINDLVDLGLRNDLKALLRNFDKKQIDALASEENDFSILNAQQWLLMGLARASRYHGASLSCLQEDIQALGRKDEIHATNKLHILRILRNIGQSSKLSKYAKDLETAIFTPTKGCVVKRRRLASVASKTGFHFDYEFNKHEVASLARLFGISEGEATDAIAGEIKKQWPEADDMDYFHEQERLYGRESERYENYRESVQRHALLRAATTLCKTIPVVHNSYDPPSTCPWADWLRNYDITFEDGLWLTDRKDSMPEQAKSLLITRDHNKETLEDDDTLLRTIGVMGNSEFPVRGGWLSRDGVRVHFTSALAAKKGIIGKCLSFSRQPNHNIWLPTFGSDGEPDRHMERSDFEPLIWELERYPIGIDSNDEFATRYAAERDQLGKTLISRLGLTPDDDAREWRAPNGMLALRSQVWGQWRPDRGDHRAWYQDNGMMLWADKTWLDTALTSLKRALVMHINFYRYKSYRSYDESPELRAVFIGLRKADGTFRFWKAKEASKTTY